MTSHDILTCCLPDYTQNSNESIHSKVWQKCSKNKHAGYHHILFVCRVTALDHNFGFEKGCLVLNLGWDIPPHMVKCTGCEIIFEEAIAKFFNEDIIAINFFQTHDVLPTQVK